MEEGSNFPHGSIVKVIYTDFLTYDNVILKPGPNLNLIIGTNGSGKSSMICGICLAVGGSPKSLGRSDKMGDYIKHGKARGVVEVQIIDEEKGVQKFKIVISKPNSCEFFVNDAKLPVKAVRELAVKYNIQIDNPCTFLAQDKVKSFSEQNSRDLLMNTERAGDTDLLNEHEALIARKNEESNMERDLKDLAVMLKNLKTEQENLRPIVENYKNRKAMQTKLAALHMKRTMKIYERAKEVYEREDRRLDLLRENLSKIKKKLKTVQCKNEGIVQKREINKKESNTLSSSLISLKRDMERGDNDSMYTDLVREAEQSFKSTCEDANNYKHKISELRNQIDILQGTLTSAQEALCGYEDFKKKYTERMRELEENKEDICNTENGLREEKRVLREKYAACESSRESFRREVNEKLELMSAFRMQGALEAWLWYEKNSNMFEHPVYIPAFHLRISLKNAKYLENVVGIRDIFMFIFGSKNDELLLTRDHSWKINTTVVTPNSVDPSVINTVLPDSLRRLKFTNFISELFESPDPVKQYLCNVFRIHNIPIGDADDLSEDEARELYTRMRIQVVLTSVQRISVTISKYSSAVMFSNSDLRNPKVFLKHTKPMPVQEDISRELNELSKRKRNIEEGEANIARQRCQIEEKKKGLKQESMEWRNKKDRINQISNQICMKEEELKSKLQTKPNLTAAKAELEEARAHAYQTSMKHVDLLISKNASYFDLYKKYVVSFSSLESLKNEMYEHDRELRFLCDEEAKASHALQEEKRELMELKVRVDNQQRELSEVCGLSTLDCNEMEGPEKTRFEKISRQFAQHNVPDDMDAIEDAIAQEEARRKMSRNEGSEKDVHRLDEVTKEYEIAQERFKSLEETKDNWNENMKNAIVKWREPILKLVEKINKNYRSFFKRVGKECAGEVHLEIPTDELDISAYGIKIMVSFRASEPLKRLDHQVQSGGERSVSTMLYLLSLQELCPVPFRCVDEINQGMDPTNERKVFDIMVERLTGDGTLSKTQYFLLTPKLLRGLNYNEKVRVQIVHNGPLIPSNAYKWDVNSFRKTMREQQSQIEA